MLKKKTFSVPSLWVRIILYFITFLTMTLPLGGFVFNLYIGEAIKFMNIVVLFLFGLLFFRMFRMCLWNTYGREIIEFKNGKINYVVDYKYFKDKLKEFTYTDIKFDLKEVGYEEDKKAVLVIYSNDRVCLETVTKIDIEVVRKLVKSLNNSTKLY